MYGREMGPALGWINILEGKENKQEETRALKTP